MEQGMSGGEPALQFDRAEPVSLQSSRACTGCKQAIERQYFEAGGHVFCTRCATQLNVAAGWRGALRALCYGGLAALLGTGVWVAIVKLTDREFGLIAIGVGLAVGMAVRKGARGAGGWKYQAMAMALTYLSITASYVPLILQSLREQEGQTTKPAETAADATGATAEQGTRGHEGDTPAAVEKQSEQSSDATKQPVGLGTLIGAFAFILAIAMASPFLAGFENIMGLIIIAIALYEAWKINKAVPVNGPFHIGPAPVPAAAQAEVELA